MADKYRQIQSSTYSDIIGGTSSTFNEADHPRDADGKFTNKNGGNSSKTHRQNTSDDGIIKKNKSTALIIDNPEAQELYTNIANGKHYSIEELKNHPVVMQLDKMSDDAFQKYGDTSQINTKERQRQRALWEQQFLGRGSQRSDGQVKREYKAVIVIGLPASGKSTRVVNPVSEQIGGFIFDNDEIKELIPEFKATNGTAANSVHNESKAIQQSAFSRFKKSGERNGDNLVIPIIGDKLGDFASGKGVLGKWIKPLEDAGYDVEVKFQDANPTESANRAVKRALDTGRIIKSDIVLGYGDKPRGVFEQISKMTSKKGRPYVRKEAN